MDKILLINVYIAVVGRDFSGLREKLTDGPGKAAGLLALNAFFYSVVAHAFVDELPRITIGERDAGVK